MSEEKEIQKQSDEKENEKKELSEQDLKQVTGGAVDYFLQIKGVDGESTDAKHNKEIEILAFNPNIKP